MGGTNEDLIGPISSTNLPEGTWNWVEIYVDLTSTGFYYNISTMLKINGKAIGTSKLPNFFAKAAPLNRLRYGIVSTAGGGSGNLTAYFDRASISHSERGPTPAPDEDRVSLWQLAEVGETTATDLMGAAPGIYTNSPTQGRWGIVGAGLNNSTDFDGVNDYVAITPTAPLNTKGGITLEAWVKPDALQGSVVRRNNAYELRPQGDGSVLFRVWIGGNVQSLTSAKGVVTTNDIYYLVGTYNGATMTIYVNGEKVASKEQTGTLSHGSDDLYIGRNDGSGTYFDGIIDEIAIYSDALDPSDIAECFEDGKTRNETLDQLPNPSATTDLSGWSAPEHGELTRSTTKLYSAPAGFGLVRPHAGSDEYYHPVLTTVSGEVKTALQANEPYTFRFRGRWGGNAPGLVSFSGGCIRLYLVDSTEKVYCSEVDEDTIWRGYGTSFTPAAEVKGYRIEFTFTPEGFLEAYFGSMYFDDIELVG
jgi:hypothetical protein